MLAQFTLLTTIMFVVPVFSDDNLFSFIALGDWGGNVILRDKLQGIRCDSKNYSFRSSIR